MKKVTLINKKILVLPPWCIQERGNTVLLINNTPNPKIKANRNNSRLVAKSYIESISYA